MKRYIALLRGINVGGKNPLPMAELVALLESLGASDITTYIQSGNAVFRAERPDAAQLAGKLAAAILKRRGFLPHVLVLGLDAMEQAIAQNPFHEAESDPATLHLGFLDAVPAKPDLETMERMRKANERFHLADRVFYLHAPEGVGRSKLAASAENLIGVPMTSRNWKTVRTIWELARK